uniref:ribonuclease E n=1 Tax=Chroodactylon ornatum TaxID=139907 RepID=UPI001FCD0C11|nr:ribonuclease E [Chroodactylon ornatum]UNJ14677.1 ribonuclease E [Chroodactylon ornatum]
MEKYIVISSFHNLAALLHDGYLYELIINNSGYHLGSIYLGSVARIFPNLKAIFVIIQMNRRNKNGFISIHDLNYLRNKNYLSISKIVLVRQRIHVQVIKEAFLAKSPRLTTNITMPGRYILYSPMSKVISISRQIVVLEHKEYFKSLALLMRPFSSGGIFFKYNAHEVDSSRIFQEWETLKTRWQVLLKISNQKIHLESCLLYQDSNFLKKIIRDVYNSQVQSIFVDSSQCSKKLRFYLKHWQCDQFNPNSKIYVVATQLLHNFKIQSAMLQAFKLRVDLIPTGCIFIETFEALTVIDVNSGISEKQKYPVKLIPILNCSAAKEIAYQIKMRNIAGVIIIDFIDMQSKKDQLELLRYLHRLFRFDKAHTQIVQFSELGLVEITRKRTEKNISEFLQSHQVFFSSLDSTLSLKGIKNNNFIKSYIQKRLALYQASQKFTHFNNVVRSKFFLRMERIQYRKKKLFFNTFLQKSTYKIY